jgi:diphthamide biosynthesis protein 2
VYLLADTTFNSLAVDEVAAEHVRADCVIHYGHASLSPVAKIPAYFVLPYLPVEEDQLLGHITEVAARSPATQPLLVLLDLAYMHTHAWLSEQLQVRCCMTCICTHALLQVALLVLCTVGANWPQRCLACTSCSTSEVTEPVVHALSAAHVY